MSANEVAERFAAACWVKLGSSGGESINQLDPDQISYRSRQGFRDRIITTVDAQSIPLIILPLDRTFSRRETAVIVNRIGTVGPYPDSRESYPLIPSPPADVAKVIAQPILLEWLGPDLSTPLYMPFGLPPTTGIVPGDSSLDLFDAIALLLPVNLGGEAGDVCVALFQHAAPDTADEEIEEVLPAVDPFDPIVLEPMFWWRMDDTTDSGGDVESFNPRSALADEGQLTLGTPVPAPLAPNPLGNNQPSFSDAGNQLEPLGFPVGYYDFLGGATWSVYIVAAPRDTQNQAIMSSGDGPPPSYQVFSDPEDDELVFGFEEYGATPIVRPWTDAVDTLQLIVVKVNEGGVPELLGTSSTPGPGTSAFTVPAPGTAPFPQFNSTTEGGGLVDYFEIIGFDRILSPAEETELVTYFGRYGTFG